MRIVPPISGRTIALLVPRYSYRIAAYQAAADSLGIHLAIISDGEHSVLPAVRSGIQVPLDDPMAAVPELVRIGRQAGWDAIFATEDALVEVAARVGLELGLVANPPDGARLTSRKDLARAHLERARVPVPTVHVVSLAGDVKAQLDSVSYPCVAKPVALSGSRGVIRANTADELDNALARIRRIVDAAFGELGSKAVRDTVLLEQYVPGVEIAIEGMIYDGEFEVIAIFDKPDPLVGPYFEETYYVTPSRHGAAQLERAVAAVRDAVRAYGLSIGPVHAEVRMDGDDVWIIEVASRTIGGDCARLLDYQLGRPLEELVLLNLLGERVPLDVSETAAGVMMIPTHEAGTLRRVEGVIDATRVPFVEDVVIALRSGYELIPLPEGSTYLGFIFARAPRARQVEDALRAAYAALRVVAAPRWELLPDRSV
ncbi:MAG: ATP-grasp domain-containing protein, partial [Pseudomonadota bacterium]